MTRATRLFLALALLLAPILHPAAMAGLAEASVGSAHHCAVNAGEDMNGDDAAPSHHGPGIHASCAASGACDLQTTLASAARMDRSATMFRVAGIVAPAGLDIPPDPSPPRASF
jgi:hypothetical protein